MRGGGRGELKKNDEKEGHTSWKTDGLSGENAKESRGTNTIFFIHSHTFLTTPRRPIPGPLPEEISGSIINNP